MIGRVYPARELYERLAAEHQPGDHYRGQIRVFPGPLWPSAFRNFFYSGDCLTLEGDLRLRSTGTRFHLRTGGYNWQAYENEIAYIEAVKRLELKFYICGLMRGAFGYPLGEAFFQQAGWQSEGLDVTGDLRVAFFFALNEWTQGRYRPITGAQHPGVLYRWRRSPITWPLEALNKLDFYNCPALIPVRDVFLQFETCEDDHQCLASLESYQAAIGWNALRWDLDEISGKRPFHMIRIPKIWKKTSRIVRQSAALLLPDVVPPEQFLANHHVTSPAVLQEIQHGMFVEDLAQNPTCETFLFDSATAADLRGIVESDSETVFPANDILFSLLRGWPRKFLQNPYGILPVTRHMPKYIDFGEIYMRIFDEWETQLFV